MDPSDEKSQLSEPQSPRVPDLSETDPNRGGRRRRRRLATVYDAVAGQVSVRQVFQDEGEKHANQQQAGIAASRRPTASATSAANSVRHPTRRVPIGPDEVLFRRRDAPQRYAEYDVYAAHERDLPRGGRGVLPESDLLKAIHTYTSRYYGAMQRGRAQRQRGQAPQPRMPRHGVDERSMDETALLAFGILLEEAGRAILGQRGDLVFTEGEGVGMPEYQRAAMNLATGDEVAFSDDGVTGDNRSRGISVPAPVATVGYQEAGSWKRSNRGPKRRKVSNQEQSDGDDNQKSRGYLDIGGAGYHGLHPAEDARAG
ncbi:hypothetical protein JDV02_006713 [Purpureocillium takamizusanense]|uniref:Uncharacterized protein n=1 Tax=Purpureocillium takamizusanense TaxID=2060973 RepID=A0A9Q8QKT4_9HYPO|nr:uncharacterized protein JDV02_006713 [Purpureocillium takamizusanense]UNI20641.1 hypothetical protein JDV02_006713 [Purpureocillium takamizusanense]